MTTVQDIIAAAQALGSTDRAQVLHALWDSLPPENWAPPSDEWVREVQQRSDAVDSGEMPVANWKDARKRVRGEAGR